MVLTSTATHPDEKEKKNKIKINWLTKKPTCFGKEITSDFSLKEKIY